MTPPSFLDEGRATLNPLNALPAKDATVSISPSRWCHKSHPRMTEVTAEVDKFFLQNWNFPGEKAKAKFLKAGFSRATCLYFPLALDDRIHLACRLITILFLIDDILEHLSFEDGEIYNQRLMPIALGDALPDKSNPVEWIMYDIWNAMCECDKELADTIIDPVFEFMRAQTDRARLSIKELGVYLKYREGDVGKALLCALMRFSMGLKIDQNELNTMTAIEENCSKHISVVNDIYSWEKEVLAAQTGHKEGSHLCSAVHVLASETNLGVEATKRVLWAMVREWELRHDELFLRNASSDSCSKSGFTYMECLQYQMSGNEEWSRTTLRYVGVSSEN